MCRSIRTARRFIAHDCAKCCHSGIRKAGADVLLLGSFRTRPEGLSCRHDPSDGADRSLPQRRRRHALLALLLSWSDADELSIDFGACVCRMCPMIAIACNHVVVTTRRRCMLSAACRLSHVAFRMVPYDRHCLQPCASHRRALYQRAQTALGRSRNAERPTIPAPSSPRRLPCLRAEWRSKLDAMRDAVARRNAHVPEEQRRMRGSAAGEWFVACARNCKHAALKRGRGV